MKGRIGQRAYYDRIRPALDRRHGRVGRPDRPRLRCRSAIPLQRRRRDPRRDGHDRRHGRSPSSTTSASDGRPVGLRRGDDVPAVPGRGAPRGSCAAPGRSRRRADGRAAGRGQPADPRDPRPRSYDGCRRRRDGPARPVGLGGPRVARRRCRRPRRDLRLGCAARRPRRATTRSSGSVIPLALDRSTDRPAARRVRTRSAAIRSAASARSRPTSSSRRSSARSSTSTSRPIRATAPRRRACRRPTT